MVKAGTHSLRAVAPPLQARAKADAEGPAGSADDDGSDGANKSNGKHDGRVAEVRRDDANTLSREKKSRARQPDRFRRRTSSLKSVREKNVPRASARPFYQRTDSSCDVRCLARHRRIITASSRGAE